MTTSTPMAAPICPGIALAALAAAALACASPLGAQTVGAISVGPDPAVTVSPDDMKASGDVVKRRLEAADVYHGMDVGDDRITIYLADVADQETVTALATQVGALEFYQSEVPLLAGDTALGGVDPVLTDADIASAQAEQSQTDKSWQLHVTLTADGAGKLADYTSNHVGKYLVIVLDGVVLTSPRIMAAITGGEAVIAGQFDESSAKVLAAKLSGGRLPIPLEVLEMSQSKP